MSHPLFNLFIIFSSSDYTELSEEHSCCTDYARNLNGKRPMRSRRLKPHVIRSRRFRRWRRFFLLLQFLCPTDFTDLHRFFRVKGGWRVGEEWWRGERTLHPIKATYTQQLTPLRWRVKSKKESGDFLSRRIVLCLAMARYCPGIGQYNAVVRQYAMEASLPLVRTIMMTSLCRLDSLWGVS